MGAKEGQKAGILQQISYFGIGQPRKAKFPATVRFDVGCV